MFSPIDYMVFFGMLAISFLVGIYFGCFKKQNTTTDEYILGSKTMTTLPVAMSLIASNISGITLLGIPPDIYLHGANYFFIAIPIILAFILVNCLYLPVILKINVPNVYEYLKLRFNKRIRTFASFIYVLQVLVYNPVVAYIPAIAFSQVTGINPYLITPVVCLICVSYTTIGGFKAVVWTDVIQLGGMVIFALAVLGLGLMKVGSFTAIWVAAQEGDRTDFDFSLDATVRDNFWSITIGATILWINVGGFHPGAVQKYLSLSNKANAKWICLITCVGVVLLTNVSIVIGFILYAKYKGCDPLTTKQIDSRDQLLPHFVVENGSTISGLPGIFIAGLFCAALSSLSSSFNTLAATIYGDFVIPYISSDVSKKSGSNILKLIVVIAGLTCTALTLVVGKLGSILAFVNASQCCVAGLLVGIFSLGMLFPIANSKGAIWGSGVSFFVTFWITIFHEWYKLQGTFDHFVKPLSVENCTFGFNLTVPTPAADTYKPFILYRLSYWYNSLIGASVLIIVGLIVSWFTRDDKKDVDPNLISPICHFMLKNSRTTKNDFGYYSVKDNVEMKTYNFNKE